MTEINLFVRSSNMKLGDFLIYPSIPYQKSAKSHRDVQDYKATQAPRQGACPAFPVRIGLEPVCGIVMQHQACGREISSPFPKSFLGGLSLKEQATTAIRRARSRHDVFIDDSAGTIRDFGRMPNSEE